MDLGELLPYTGDRKAREAWDEVFSREMLGAVIIGSATGKIVETTIVLLFPSEVGQLVAWIGAAIVGVYVFVLWHRIADVGGEKVEDAAETAADVKEKAEEKAADVKEKADEATDATA